MTLGVPHFLDLPETPPPAADSDQAVLGLWYHVLASLGTIWEVGYVPQSRFSLWGVVFVLNRARGGSAHFFSGHLFNSDYSSMDFLCCLRKPFFTRVLCLAD